MNFWIKSSQFFQCNKSEWGLDIESDIQPSMVTHTRNVCSIQGGHTHSSEHTHPEQWAAIYAAAPGEHLGARCLDQGHLIVELRVERVLYIHSIHLQFLPARDSNQQPFDYESNTLTIRPQLPHDCSPWRFELTSDSNLSHSFWLNYLVAAVKIPMQGKINNASFLFITQRHQKACS